MTQEPGNNSKGYLQPYADVEWDSTGSPHSPDYGDIYWNPAQGVEEKRHVFLAANKLHERWVDRATSFAILELGFGFGLNCLLSAQLWQEVQTKPQGILNFISIEKHPVDLPALKKLYSALQDDGLKALASRLIDNYPVATSGTHLIWLSENICLTLILGEDVVALGEVNQEVDAIYLDGFSPGKNEQMWNRQVLSSLSTLCHAETTLSTYSVSGALRRGLTEAGFSIAKQPGYGRKREMLTAQFQAQAPRPVRANNPQKPIVIVGSGIAGLACAKSLQKRGLKVLMLEQAEQPISGASAISQLAVYPHISVRPDPFSIFSLSAFQYSLRENHANICGYRKFASNDAEVERLQRINNYFPDHFINYEQLNDQAYLTFESAAWLNVEEAYRTTLQRIELRTNTEVTGIEQSKDGWRLFGPEGSQITEAANVILATGYASLERLKPLGLNTNRGQAISIRTDKMRHSSINSSGRTLFPENKNGTRIFSATNSRESISTLPDASDTQKLASELQNRLGSPFEIVDEQVGIRCTTRDRIPVVGGLPSWQALDQYCIENRHRKVVDAFTGYENGLYVCTGFGAHGATHAPASGEFIARLICEEPTPTSWRGLLDPARFKLRDRNKQV